MNSSWNKSKDLMERTFTFADFQQAFSFMVQVAMEAEKMDHHPDWSNSYNKVRISLTTHDKGTVTEKDDRLATIIDSIFSRYEQAGK